MDVYDESGSLMPLTWFHLSAKLDADGIEVTGTEGVSFAGDVIPGVLMVHRHPEADLPREIHVMAFGPEGWQKIAELGPDEPLGGESKAPRYVAMLVMWMGAPVGQWEWKNRILADNGLLDRLSAAQPPLM